MPAKRGMVRALCAGAKEEEAAAQARTHRSKGKKERKKKKKKKTHGPRNARGRSRCSSAKRSSLWPAYSYDRAPRSPRRSRPGVKCQLLAGRETGESDFGSGGERTCRARYPSWARGMDLQKLMVTAERLDFTKKETLRLYEEENTRQREERALAREQARVESFLEHVDASQEESDADSAEAHTVLDMVAQRCGSGTGTMDD
ncbi:hypothetical protein HPB50_029109 [Hyalomma asiaticum]|nr:hypothetical protein HPB50_029109 [Hyalomma asiaticum]